MASNDLLEQLISKKHDYIETILRSIEALISLKDEFDVQLNNCKISNTVGNSTSILSTGLLFTPFFLVGVVGIVAGGATSAGTALTQYFIEQGKLKEIKYILNQENKAANIYLKAAQNFKNVIGASNKIAEWLGSLGRLDSLNKAAMMVEGFTLVRSAQPTTGIISQGISSGGANIGLQVAAQSKIIGALGAIASAADIYMT